MNDLREWISDNLRYILLGLFIILVLVVILLGVKFLSSGAGDSGIDDTVTQDTKNDANKQVKEETDITQTPTPTVTKAADTETLKKNADPKVNAIIQSYYTALGGKDIEGIKAVVDTLDAAEEAKIRNDQYLEGYSNIEVYSKKGLEEGSYVVFASYTYKFKDIATSVPGLSQLYVSTKEDDTLYIATQEQDQAVKDYIAKIMEEDDVKKLIQGVQDKYQEAQDSDEKLSQFIASLGEATSNATQAEVGDSLTVKNGCNVRAEASAGSDIIGELESGDTIVKQGSDGDWIEVEYDGETGYVRNDMFQ